ncbi:MAG: hypothetical protein PW734_04485 [Verrucomicrobium sp.]|nr:hypothetical protein [Verrucomicrobium sp.]
MPLLSLSCWLAGGLLLLFPVFLRADEVWLKDGRHLEGVLSAAGDALTLSLSLPGPEGRAELSCAPAEIARIALARTPAEERLLREDGSAPAWRAWWEKRRAFLGLSGSDAAEAGLGLAGALLREGDSAAAAEIAAQVQAGAFAPACRERAEAVALEAMPPAEARSAEAARAFLARPPADPAARADGWLALGRCAAARWRALPPGPERAALYQEAADALLRPSVFLPRDRARAARGLLEAARLASAAGDGAAARRYAEDLLRAFPDPASLPAARTLRASL